MKELEDKIKELMTKAYLSRREAVQAILRMKPKWYVQTPEGEYLEAQLQRSNTQRKKQ